MSLCICCGGETEVLLDLGTQPVSSHFISAAPLPSEEHALVLGLCRRCGTVQLIPPFPYESLTPPYPWITYREPEDHLDRLIETIIGLPGLSSNGTIAGVSFKDQSTLDRFGRKGFATRWCLDVKTDLGACHPSANIESVARLLTPGKATQIASTRGKADIVVARHILEHTAEPRGLLAACAALLDEGGYLVLEVPDNAKNIQRQDYTMIWEEHALYYTAETFGSALLGTPFEFVLSIRYPYRFEDCLVIVARKRTSAAYRPAAATRDDGAAIRAYARAFPEWTGRYRQAIARMSAGASAALYGAGHLTAAFVNFHDLADLFAFVVDDTPEKQGLRLPKSNLQIVTRERLVRENIQICLFGISPQIEDKVIANNTQYVHRGGAFYSVFVDSSRSLRVIS